MTMLSVYEKASRLVKFVTGEPYGDGYRITDVIDGYADPAHGKSDAVVVLGNWNPARYPRGDEPPLTAEESIMPRLADALERVGAEIEWLDEWTSCGGCYKAVRTKPDSYAWRPGYAIVCNDFLCTACLLDMGIDALEDLIDNPDSAVTWCEPEHVEGLGFVKWEPGDEHDYESGWYPGQNDDPHKILESIKARVPDSQVVFFIDSVGQFDIRFSAYIRKLIDDEGE